MRRIVLLSFFALGFLWCSAANAICPLPYVLNNDTITNAAKVMADLNALAACSGGVGPCSFTNPGSVPATGGNATFFLAGDCTFKAPPAGPGLCDATVPGLLPATGGGTVNFLRADCTFAPPPGVSLTCDSLPGGGCPFDIAIFWPGIPPNSQIVRVAIPRNVTCPANLSGSVGNSRVAAAAGLEVFVNAVSSGVDFNVGGVTWALGQTVGVPGSAAGFPTGFMLANGDDVEFVFPATADATFADIAITLKCART